MDGKTFPVGSVPRRRAGLSLLEVLFSIGIVAIGLFGVILLIPLAGYHTRRATIADRGASLAREALRQFDARGYKNPQMWVWFDYTQGQFRPQGIPDLPLAQLPSPVGLHAESYCLDPRFLAVPQNQGPQGAIFPYTDPADPSILRMRRITVRSAPLLTAPGMQGVQAEALFTGQDDLVFNLPSDRTLPPVQYFGRDVANPTRRQFAGEFSWMATLVPKPERRGDVLDPVPGGARYRYPLEYILSIVVFHQRPAGMQRDGLTERVVRVRMPLIGGGIAGGTVELTPRQAGLSRDAAREQLAVREGEWVLLSGAYRTSNPAVAYVFHRWYQVATADPELNFDPTTNQWVRHVTLHGPDLDTAGLLAPLQVTIMPGAVAVMERSVHLDFGPAL